MARIDYLGADGGSYVGSGLLVDDRTVLTADHVADGLQLVCAGVGWTRRVERVEPGSAAVDLAVLLLDSPVEGLGRLGFARVARDRVGQVSGCTAVGFPRWKNGPPRRSAQVDGMVPTAEGLAAEADEGLVAGFLTLVANRDPQGPPIPRGEDALSDRRPTSQWGGMSGAVVVAGGLVIGVVRSHNLAEGGQSLTITPVTAIERLPTERAAALWQALGVVDPAALPVLPGIEDTPASVPPRIIELRGRAPRLDFTGRDAELIALHEHLTSVPAAPVVLTGLGGVGKTQLAIEYVESHAREVNVVWMVRSDRPDVLTADLAALGDRLGLPEPLEADVEAELATVRSWLESNPGWLLLFDNVDTAESRAVVDHLLPGTGQGRVIITSRITTWPGRYRVTRVGVLPLDEAAQFLLTASGDDDSGAARQLADELGSLPLALQQAAAYCQSRGKRLREYLRILRDTRTQMRILGAGDDEGQRTVATTWQVSMQQVQAENLAAATLLDLLAYFGADAIPRSLFWDESDDEAEDDDDEHDDEDDEDDEAATDADASDTGDDPLEPLYDLDELGLDDALSVLRRYSLIDLTPEVITMHRLLQAVVRGSHDPVAAEAFTVGAATGVLNSLPTLDRSSWDEYHRLIPHALATAGHAAEHPRGVELAESLLILAGAYQRERGQFAASQATFGELVRLTQARGDSDDRLAALNMLSATLLLSGERDAALETIQKALGIAEKEYPPDHPNFQAPLSNLGNVLFQLGRSGEAEPYLRRALAIAEKEYAPDHVEALETLASLGAVLVQLGRPAEAEPYLRRAVAIAEREYAADHQQALLPLTNLGAVLLALGRPAEAEPCLRRAVAIAEQEFAPDHQQALLPLTNLGAVLLALGRPAEGEPYLRRAVAIAEKEYPPDHLQALTPMTNLGSVLLALGRSDEGEPYLRRAVAIAEQEYAPDHPQALLPLSNLGAALWAMDHPADAEPYLRRALAIAEKEYVPDHPQALTPMTNLGSVLLALDRSAEAEPYLRRALAIAEKDFAPDHQQALSPLTNLGSVLMALGRSEEAEPYLRRAVAIAEQEYAPDHPQALSPLFNLGSVVWRLGRPEEAEPYLRRALAIAGTVYAPDHRQNLFPLRELAGVLFALGRWDEAEPLLRRALAIAEQQYAPDHRQALSPLRNLGEVLRMLSRPAEAEPFLRRALAITEQEYAPDHQQALSPLNNLGSVLLQLGHPAEAEPLLRRALAIAEQEYAPDHLQALFPLGALGSVLLQRGRPDEAEPLLRRALAIADKEYPPDHVEVLYPLKRLAEVHRQTGRLEEALPFLRRALAVDERRYGEENDAVRRDRQALVSALETTHHDDEARSQLARALAITERTDGPHAVALLPLLRQLGASLERSGEVMESAEVRQRLVLLSDHLGEETPGAVDDVTALAALREQLGEPTTAAQLRTTAKEMLRRRTARSRFLALSDAEDPPAHSPG